MFDTVMYRPVLVLEGVALEHPTYCNGNVYIKYLDVLHLRLSNTVLLSAQSLRKFEYSFFDENSTAESRELQIFKLVQPDDVEHGPSSSTF